MNSSASPPTTQLFSTNETKQIFGVAEHQPTVIVFVFGCCALGALLRILLQKWANYVDKWKWGSVVKIPYSVFLIAVGMILAAIGRAAPAVNSYLVTDIDPELFFHVFLPVVIFESAYVIDIHVFWRSIGNVAFLAVPGLLVATALTAVLSLIIPEIAEIQDTPTRVYVALLFGTIVSATDPVAVVAMLKELGCQKHLNVVIEGEALLNDGSAIVVFKICLELLKSTTPYYPEMNAGGTIMLILQQSLLGPVIGWIAAKLEGFILQKIYNDALAEITVTLSFTYLTFYFGEKAKTSGVLGVVTLGLALDRSAITPQVDHFLHRFWEMLAYLANTLIFVIVGVLVAQYIHLFTGADAFYLFILYIGIIVIRAISVFMFFPLMNRFGIKMTWRHMLIMTWGGLRGVVGLTLALFLNGYAKLLMPEDQQYDNDAENETLVNQTTASLEQVVDTTNYHAIFLKILMFTGGIVILTLFINASTTEFVLKQLGMLEVSAAEKATMLNAVRKIQDSIKRSIAVLKCQPFLADSRWRMVEKMTEVEYPYKGQATAPQTQASFPGSSLLHIANSQDLAFKDLYEEARLRTINALKMSYMKQYRHGLLQDQEARVLIAAADKAMDNQGQFINVQDVRKAWEVTGMFPYIRGRLEYWMYGRKIVQQLTPPRNRHRRKVFRLITNENFDIFMQVIILLNIIPIGFDLAHDDTWDNADEWLLALEITNYVFLVIYTIELILRFTGLGWTQFRKNRWIQFDSIILFIAFGEVIADKVLLLEASASAGNILNTVRLHTGYNVGKGFVTAEEEVNKLFGSICNNEIIQHKLFHVSEKNRLMVIKEMGLLQRDHPGIATSVKTKNAIRTLLNHIRDSIQLLFSGGVLDETELRLLEQNLEIKQKQLFNFPSTLMPAEPIEIVQNIVWVKDNPELFQYIINNAEYKDFDYEDVIIDHEEELDGIHVVLKGMVKVVSSINDTGVSYGKRIPHSALISRKTNGDSVDNDTRESSHDWTVETDYLGVGAMFGDFDFLTDGFKRCTVTCETVVQTMFLSVRCLEEAFVKFPYLRKTLWKVVAIRTVTPLYQDRIEYQGLNLAQIHLQLAQGYIVELNDEQPTFSINAEIAEASLVFGSVVVKATDEILEAPFLLLSEYEEVSVHWCPFVILFVIPKETTKFNADTKFRSSTASKRDTSKASQVTQSISPGRESGCPIPEVSVVEVEDELREKNIIEE